MLRARGMRLIVCVALALPLIVVSTAVAGRADPAVSTGGASSATSTSAALSGTGTLPGGALYVFQYGPSASLSSYSSSFTEASTPAGAPAGTLTAVVTALQPATTYYYRLVGMQGGTDTDGATLSFTTQAAPPSSTTTTTAPGTTVPPSTTTTTAPSSTVPPTTSTVPQPGGTASGSAGASGARSNLGAPITAPPPGPIAPTANGQGYWLVTSAGVVVPHGNAASHGDLSQWSFHTPIVGLTPTPDGNGYWLLASNGAVYGFGDAEQLGSAIAQLESIPAVSLTPTPDGKGYWILSATGDVFAFGDARDFGSAAGVELPSFAVGMSATPDGQGYWIVLANGAVLNFGDAMFFGSAGGIDSTGAAVGIASTPDGQGYWEVDGSGRVYGFGDAKSFGSAVDPGSPVVALTPTSDSQGYWLVSADGTVDPFGDAPTYPAAPGAAAPVSGFVGMSTPVLRVLAGVPLEYVVLDQEAAATCPGMPWEILTAIAKVESNFGESDESGVTSGANAAGAAGPMQMGIGGAAGMTFFSYAHPVKADRSPTPSPPGANPPSPYNVADASFAAARDLCTNGAGRADSLNDALLAYNHAQWYANEVETLAAVYAGSASFSLGTSPAMASAVHLALSQIGVPYSWGGASPGVGFDCSGLVQWAYGLSGVALPRTTYAQWASLTHLPPGSPLAVGDLLFFEPTPEGPGHVGIYIGNGLMVDAPHTGAAVRIEPYNWPSYVGAALP